MKFSLDLSEEPKFATKLEKQNLGKLGIFLKLPENFWQLFNSRKIVLPKFNDLIKDHSFQYPNMLIIDKGRSIDEKSVILIKNKKYVGYGYFTLNYQINNIEILESLIKKCGAGKI